jgi:hypothetical protein
VMRVCISAKRVRCSNEGFWDERMCCTYTKEKRRNLRESGGRSLNPRLILKGFSFWFWLFRVLEKISVSATCVIVSKKDANFSASERGIYTRDVIRSERYTNDRERRKRGRSGRHRGGTVHSFYFYCSFMSGSIARVLTLLCLLFPKLLALEYNCLPSRRSLFSLHL